MSAMLADLIGRVRSIVSGAPASPFDIVQAACLDPSPPDPAPRSRAINLCYFIGTKNVGDRISPVTVEHATGRPTIWRRRPKRPHLLGLGSILTWSTPLSHVWGTGIMHPERGIGGVRGERIWALRGKLTRDQVVRQVTGLRDVPLGDPGWLIGRHLASLMPERKPTHALGIVPHYLHRDHPGIAHLRRQEGVIVLDVRDPEPRFFAQLMSCAAIAGSSLHGLIFAEALGIPNLWLDVGGSHPERDFKYWDWFSLAERPPASPRKLGAEPAARDLTAEAALHDIKIDENALRNAVPHSALDEVSRSGFAAPRIAHVLSCRRRPLPIFVICRGPKSRLHEVSAAYGKQSIATEIVPIEPDDDLGQTIRRHFRSWGEPARYAFVDDSIDFSIASADSLALYDELLDRFPGVGGVGPMLRISDLPRHMPDFARTMNTEIAAHWSRPPTWRETSFGPVAIVKSTLAGTFALRRAGEKFRGPSAGLRVYYPFEARKYDWAPAASSDAPQFDHYYRVERNSDGALNVVVRSPRQDNPV